LGENAHLPAGPRQDILGFPVSALDFAGNAALIARAALAGQGMWVLTLNMEMVARAATKPSYRALMHKVDLAVADGMPIVLLSRLGLTPFRIDERSCGIDLAQHLLKTFPGRIGIIGGSNPKAALQKLGVGESRIVYLNDGPIDPKSLRTVYEEIKAAKCQLLLVGLGVPKQDAVCRALHKALPHLVCIGVGGSFEILSGARPRAPKLARDLGLEWLFRLMLEPRRLAGRYLVLYPRGLPSILGWVLATRSRRPLVGGPPLPVRIEPIMPDMPSKIAAMRGDDFTQRGGPPGRA
jgi:N-acetylglucosaminyldiphosphoundecaprenol N-acetyl-beta-D-mannosaminyltransferase